MTSFKQVVIRLGLWEEEHKRPKQPDLSKHEIVDTEWYLEACKHYCGKCNRWFEKYSGLRMHNFHHEKRDNQSST